MPADWRKLARETARSYDADEVRGMWSVDWRRAREAFFEDHRAEIEAEPRRYRRRLLQANAVVYGLARRLAPPRRLVFALVLVLVVLALLENSFSDRQSGFAFLALLVAVLALVFLLAMELVDKLHFKDELVMARALQAQLVPRPLPEIGDFELAGESRVANTVGGDFFAFEPLPGGRVVVLFGDASGHGMAAGLVMAVTHAAFRTQLRVDPAPAAVAASLNGVLCETGSARSFFAGVCGLLEADGSFSAIVAGHPPVLKLGPDGRIVERLGTGSYPLGIRKSTVWTPQATSVAPGETLLFHSDGLPEARGASGEEFGDARVEAIAARMAGARPGELVAAMTADLDRFLGRTPADDDVSIAAIRRKTA
ncbi:MAG: SpoIIE family protein phosphatase [Thermoanaerobaculia bacterium]|jgi:sigma-B regulation protein RsbU (phosphoserine phosphatase)